LPGAGAAQSTSIYVNHDKVDVALAKGGALINTPNVTVAGAHRERGGALDPRKDTTNYVTDGEATIDASGQTQRLTKGDVMVIPAGTTQSFKDDSRPMSYYLVTVPVRARSPMGPIL
jgi:quercetin dioxygenase-like cupin family protein